VSAASNAQVQLQANQLRARGEATRKSDDRLSAATIVMPLGPERGIALCLMVSEGRGSEIIPTLCPAGAGCATRECTSVLLPHQSLGTSTLELLRP
jgi:hypothetical protein